MAVPDDHVLTALQLGAMNAHAHRPWWCTDLQLSQLLAQYFEVDFFSLAAIKSSTR